MRYRPTVNPPSAAARIVAAIGALVLGLLAVFLFAAIAVVAVLLAAVGLIRLWWLSRQVDRPNDEGITVQDTVQTETIRKLPKLPPNSETRW